MEDSTNMYMPVAPAYGAGNQSGFGFGGDWAWILLLLVLFGNNGWGMGGFGGGGFEALYPWMNNSQNINGGFRDQMLTSQISGIQTSLTTGFADIAAAIAAAQNATQIAILQQTNGLQAQLAQCCCDNRLATAGLSADIAREACANRTVVSDGIRDLMAANASNTTAILGSIASGVQSLKDQLCQDKLDAKDDIIAQLRSQITALNLASSQGAQTAAIIANNEAQTAALERYLSPVPVPAYIVANPNGCNCGTCAA